MPTASATKEVDYDVRVLELGDGLHVVLERAPDFGAAVAVLVVGAGSASEPAEQAGLAHLVGHLSFSASHAGVSLEERRRSFENGLNAYTSWDATTFSIFDRTSALEDAVVYLTGILREPMAGVDERIFRREWQVASNERRWRLEVGTPGEAEGWLMAAAFTSDHPYGHPISGTAEGMARLSMDDARAFAAAHYRPEKSTLVISAPLDFATQQALVERITGQAAREGVPRRAAARIDAGVTSRPPSFETRRSNVPTPTLWLGWSIPSGYGARGDVAPLLASILDRSAGYDLGERDTDIATVDASVVPGVEASLFIAKVTLKKGAHPEKSARTVTDEIEGGLGRLARRQQPLKVTERFASTDLLYRDETMVDRALDMAHSYQELGVPSFLRRRGDRILQLPEADVLDYARTYLGPDRAHAIMVWPGPAQSPEDAPHATPAALVAAGEPTGTAAQASTFAPPRSAPASDAAYPPWLLGLTTRRLSNGLQLILLPRAGSPFHTVLLGFKGGKANASPVGVTVADLWGRQFEDWSPRLWGVDFHTRVTESATTEVLRGPGREIQQTLKYLRRELGYSILWPPRGFQHRVDVFEREDRAPPAVLGRTLAHAVYGEQPLGQAPTAKELQQIRPAEVTRWVNKVRRPSNGALVIVGDLDPDAVAAAAEAELGGWGRNASPGAGPSDPPPLASLAGAGPGQVFIQDRADTQQPTIQFDCVLPLQTPDNVAAQLVFELGLKRALFVDLRERAGASYDVSGFIDQMAGGTSVLRISADISYDELGRALRQVRTIVAHPETVASDAAIFGRTRQAAAFDLRVGATTTEWLAGRLFHEWTYGWPLEVMDRLPAQALKASADEVTRTATHCAGNWVIGLLGDGPRLRQAWAESAP
jgi:zinc protease